MLLTTGLLIYEINGQQIALSEETFHSLPIEICSVVQPDKFFSIEAEYPQFKTAASDFNQRIADLIWGKINEFKETSWDNWKTKLDNISSGETLPLSPEIPFPFIASWQPTQLNNRYLSFTIKMYYFTGGAHGDEEIYAFNYDMVRNKEIHIEDFLGFSQEALKKISEISAKDIMSQLQCKGWEEVTHLKEMVNDGAAPVFDNFGNFNFDSYSLIIYFQKYQVAPGAAGLLTVTISRTILE
ncbi:DUF3298 and DUF4163 domain-containing protein [Candidatus Aerophobetes bacterium]|nr:DUF3298 and DUF4163 domain-containing protein [Candidatus Aerophobetes bacterium]